MADLNQTPRGERVHIGFFGPTNAGKSSMVNRISGIEAALVSPVSGTTTDPVYKSMELLPIGPVVLIDTPGTGDDTELGSARAKKTRESAERTDIAVFVRRKGTIDPEGEQLAQLFSKRGVPVISVFNDFGEGEAARNDELRVNAQNGEGIGALKKALSAAHAGSEDIAPTRGLVQAGDLVVLVMPQDIQAPKGRLILPQVQMIRELLDSDCRVLCVKPDDLPAMLEDLKKEPALVITDSQVFPLVDARLPAHIPLTSFSILMSKKKGDVHVFMEGAHAIGALRPGDRVLIAESCTHHALKGDIAREKIPAKLEQAAGGPLEVDVFSGPGFPESLENYRLIVQCGGCMANRRNMLSRIEQAKAAGVPITNFGTALAWLAGITDRVIY